MVRNVQGVPFAALRGFSLAGTPAAGARATAGAARFSAGLQATSAREQREMEQAQFGQQMGFYQQMLGQQQQQMGGLSGMINQYNQAFQQAKAANEQKYQQALGVVGTTSGQQRADVLSQYQGQRASAMQRLSRIGMANTTVAPTLQAGIQREQQGALNRVSDQMMQARLGVMQGFQYKYPEPGITQAAIDAMAPRFQFPSF